MFEILGVTFHWYGLILGVAVLMAMEIGLSRTKKENRNELERVMWWVITGGVIGARLYHVIDYWQRYYSLNPVKIFLVWEGGLGIWGAVIGGILALGVYCFVKKMPFWKTLDSLVIGVPLAQAIGRLGNWVNGELLGKNGEPLFAYESVLNLILFGILWKTSSKVKKPGVLAGIYLFGYGVIRSVLENMRPSEIIWKIGSLPTAILCSVLAMILGAFLIWRKQS